MSIDRGVMLDKLQALAARYDELLHAMADPRVLADQERFQRAAREQASLEETVSAFREYQRVSKEADEARVWRARSRIPSCGSSRGRRKRGCESGSRRWRRSSE